MLILTRKQDQRLILNDNIVVTVLSVDGDRVKLGISAPPEVTVLREELHRVVSGENRRAAAAVEQRKGMEHALRTLRSK